MKSLTDINVQNGGIKIKKINFEQILLTALPFTVFIDYAFQENNMTLTSTVMKRLAGRFEGKGGIDLEGMFRFLSEAHNKTGRDSVLAIHKR